MKRFVIIILTILTFQFCTRLGNDARLENDEGLAQQIKETVLSGKEELRLRDLTDFQWDNLLILTPYTQIDRIEKKYQIDLSQVQDLGIGSRDGITQLIFFLNKKAVRTIAYPRYPGDFAQRGPEMISIDSAIFAIIVTDRETVGGDKWIELKRK
jgi:hypothetical protein